METGTFSILFELIVAWASSPRLSIEKARAGCPRHENCALRNYSRLSPSCSSFLRPFVIAFLFPRLPDLLNQIVERLRLAFLIDDRRIHLLLHLLGVKFERQLPAFLHERLCLDMKNQRLPADR